MFEQALEIADTLVIASGNSDRHVRSIADIEDRHADLLADIAQAATQLAAAEGIEESGWRLVTNVGPDAGQTIFHLHLHLLGRAAGQVAMRPIDRLEQTAGQVRELAGRRLGNAVNGHRRAGGIEQAQIGSAGSYLTAIDPKTGKIAWRRPYPGGGSGASSGTSDCSVTWWATVLS